MRIVSTSYINTPEFSDPYKWLDRICFFTGILDELAKQYQVESIEQVSFSGLLERNGVRYHFLNFKKPKLYFPGQLHNYIGHLEPDLVLVNGCAFPLQVIQLRLALGKKAKIIVINHAERPFTGIRKFLQRQADRFVHRYFFTAKEMGLDWVRRGIIANENKIAEAMEASSFFIPMNRQEAIGLTHVEGSPVFLWVGRLDANKDPLTVIKAFGKFLRQQPSAKLYMLYHTEELKQEILSYCGKDGMLQHAVKLVGKIPHEEMKYWYNSADFIISASHHEGSGIAVCEAMSCGCIPILSDIPSFRKMTGPGKCGFVYEKGNDVALSTILSKTGLLNREAEKKKVLQQFKEELSFEAIAEKYTDVINSL